MPNKPSKPCRICGKATLSGEAECEQHSGESSRRYSQSRGWADKTIHGSRDWKRFKELLRSNGNVQCQRLLPDGSRCLAVVEIYHHLQSVEARPDLAYDATNVIGLCRSHHPATAGTPDWKPSVDYVPTVYTAPWI